MYTATDFPHFIDSLHFTDFPQSAHFTDLARSEHFTHSGDFAYVNDFNDFTDLPVFIPNIDNYVPVDCNYVKPDDLSSFITTLSLTFLLFNVRSLKRNFNSFLAEFTGYLNMFSFIAFTETWLTVDRDITFNLSGFNSINLYRNQYGGGLRLYYKDCFKVRILEDFTFINEFYEVLSVVLDLGYCKYILVLVYHPPTSSVQNNNMFINLFTLKLQAILNIGLPVIIMGDFNLNLLNQGSSNYVDCFINNMFELGMCPLITRPTKVSLVNQIVRCSLLDHVWTSAGVTGGRSFIFPLHITDHFPVCVTIENANLISSVPSEIETRVFSEKNKATFRILLDSIKLLTTSTDFNFVFNDYYTKLFAAYNLAFPKVRRRQGGRRATPWMTDKLRKCVQKKAELYKLYLKGRLQKTAYTSFRNKLTSIIRRVKALYYAKLFLENTKNTKQIWYILNGLLGRNAKNPLTELLVNDSRLRGHALVSYINKSFINMAVSIRGELTFSVTFRCLAPCVASSCFFRPTNIRETKDIIRQLKNKGSKLLDLHPLILKENIELFSYHVMILYNFSLQVCIFPELLKIARVAPVFKSGDPENIDNYRPISSLPVLSKLFERLTLNRMLSFIYEKDILSANQFGFRKGRRYFTSNSQVNNTHNTSFP